MKSRAGKLKLFLYAFCPILAMVLTACSQETKNDYVTEFGEGKIAGDNESSMQYTYSNTVIDLSDINGNVVICDVAGNGSQVYALIEVQTWEYETEDYDEKQDCQSYYQVFSCLPDGSGNAVSKEIYLETDEGYADSIQLSDDGCVAALYYLYDNDSVRLLFWNLSQDIHWEREISLGDYLFLRDDEIVILSVNGDECMLNSYNTKGEMTDSIEVDAETFSLFTGCYLLPDKKFLLTKIDDTGMFYGEIYNPATDMTEKVTLPDNFSQYKVFNGTKTDVLLCDSSGIYQYNAGDNMPTEIFSYIDADLDINGLQMIYQTDETHFLGSFSEGGYPKIVLFKRSELPEGVQKQNIILGTSDELDAELRSRIISFNRENSQYKISVRQYVSYNKEMSAAVQLNMDIMSGNMPDILVIDSETPLESYISKGLIADIGKLIEQDDELENNQFMENIFDAFCVDGVLYYVVPGFSVDTLVAKQTKVGNRTGWNNKEFTEVIADISEETEILSESSRYSYITDFMSVCGREFVDMDSGKCNFGSEDFKSALEFAATLPETVEKSQYEENSFDSRYIEDRALLQPVTICKISNLTQQINGSIGQEIAYVGYPCENREGSCIKICGNGFVLSGKSDKLDGAWQFVRYYLTEDYQRNEMFDKGMPTRKDLFYEKAQSAAEYEGYCFINEEFVPLPPLTQEQIDAAVSFIEGLHNTAFEDEVIMNIIFEEAESFFNGNRTVEDVAKVIQNRVQLYLNEA